MIDWTKPIETINGIAARVERVLENGNAIVSWQSWPSCGTLAVAVYDPKVNSIRNVPPKARPGARVPRGGWVYVYDIHDTREAAEEANGHDGRYSDYVHVREVLPE